MKIKKAKTTSKTIKKLEGGTRYYVRIRTYRVVNKKTYYSGWSKIKSVKTKGTKAKGASDNGAQALPTVEEALIAIDGEPLPDSAPVAETEIELEAAAE